MTTLVVGVTWAFGGNADWVRTPISIWASLGALVTIGTLAGRRRGAARPQLVRWAWPVAILNAVVLTSCLTPGFHLVTFAGESMAMPAQVKGWMPSAAQPGVALRSLWLFDGLYLSCLNLALAVKSRRVLRMVLAVAVGNALVLAVFGIAQKISGATGIYFGWVASPQDYFFSTFVYDNHWGAFMVLMMGGCIGLVLRYAYGSAGEGFFRGPAFSGVVAACVLAASTPLSGSRAGTLLLGLLFAVALVHGAPRISGALKYSGTSSRGAIVAIVVALALALGGIWTVAGDVIQARATKTKEQAAQVWAQRGLGSRGRHLYRDTWHMASDRMLFMGWGQWAYPSRCSLSTIPRSLTATGFPSSTTTPIRTGCSRSPSWAWSEPSCSARPSRPQPSETWRRIHR